MQNKHRDDFLGPFDKVLVWIHSPHEIHIPKMSPEIEIHLGVSSWQATSEDSGFSRLANFGYKTVKIDGSEEHFFVGKHRKELNLSGCYCLFRTLKEHTPPDSSFWMAIAATF